MLCYGSTISLQDEVLTSFVLVTLKLSCRLNPIFEIYPGYKSLLWRYGHQKIFRLSQWQLSKKQGGGNQLKYPVNAQEM